MPNSYSSSCSSLVRVPAFLFIYTVIALEVIFYFFVRLYIYLYERVYYRCRSNYSDSGKSRKSWDTLLARGCSYSAWFQAAANLDHSLGMNNGSLDINLEQDAIVLKLAARLKAALFSRRGTQSQFMKILTKESAKDLIADLRLACSPHLGSVGNENSYRWNHQGTNSTLHEFSELIESALVHVLRNRDIFQTEHGRNKRLRLFQSLRQNYGTTALCMSGGAANGYFHLGMVKALLHYNMMPQIITGSSAGSLICACIASRTNAELELFLNQDASDICQVFQPVEGNLFTWLYRWFTTGAAIDPSSWYQKLDTLMKGTWTFAEAWERTGRDLFICVYSEGDQTRVLNWRTTPDVLIASAVIASSALPHLMHGQRLRIKRPDGTIVNLDDGGSCNSYFDGSLKHDVPLEHLNTHFSQLNCRYTIVSQVEPHILPFFYCPKGSPGAPEIVRRGHGLRGGFLMSFCERFIKLDIRKYLSLVRDLGLNPNAVQDFDDAWLQKTWGDVTIRPDVEVWDYLSVFSNPTVWSMKNKMRRGELATYPFLCMISHRYKIEQCLKRCCREAAAAVANGTPQRSERVGLPTSLSLSSSLSLLAQDRSSPSGPSLRNLSIAESRQIEKERDEMNVLLLQERSRCDFLQQSWDDEKMQRLNMEANVQAFMKKENTEGEGEGEGEGERGRGKGNARRRKSGRREVGHGGEASGRGGGSSNVYPQ